MRVFTQRGLLFCAVFLIGTAATGRAQEKKTEQIDPPDWKTLRAAYDYDNKKALDSKNDDSRSGTIITQHVEFTGVKGDMVPGVFERPRKEGVYPVVLLLHGLGRSKEEMLKIFGAPLVAKGFAILALDAPHHGERKMPGDNPQVPNTLAEAMRDGGLDYRRALDWLATRKDVDIKHVGLLGYSMGAFMGAILGAVDERIEAFVLCAGGDPIIAFLPQVPEQFRAQIFTICPSLYIEHIAPRPVLMLNGTHDSTVSEASSKRLYDAAKDPKEQIWYDAGHAMPPPAIEKCVSWLGEKLKKDRKATPADSQVDSKTDKK